MLQIKNVTKIYKTKSGETAALKNVSVDFNETGMVFILGKSGSGKSSLLNICGGLDAPTSGELIVKGKSSATFSSKDFDSYRNTYVGFIFQEYNILNEFSVEDNIALALELQGKPKDKELIRSLLRQVDLQDFANRKPNTLSGGQKQRIAIARALIKNPEIILADEPSGALDSNTGKQVFDTLKKLSKDKLVVVVSHDREFAEIYADRIIELKDGEIISDVSKSIVESKEKNDNYSFVGNDTILIKSGSSLSDDDIAKINGFLRESQGDLLLSRNENGIAQYKKQANITDDGSQEVFKDTDTSAIAKTDNTDGAKMISSKLPLRHALKIGASGMKVKPFRFLFTVLLSVISFVMFGMFSTVMFYDSDKIIATSLEETGTTYLKVENSYFYDTVNYSDGDSMTSQSKSAAKLSASDVALIKSKYGDDTVFTYDLKESKILNVTPSQQGDYSDLTGFVPAESSLNYLYGRAPASAYETAISNYTYNVIKNGKYTDPETRREVLISDYSDIKLMIEDGSVLNVVGVYQNHNLPSKQNAKQTENFFSDGLYAYGVITKDTYDKIHPTLGQQFYYKDGFNSLYGINYGIKDHTSVINSIAKKDNAKVTTFAINGSNASDKGIAMSFAAWHWLYGNSFTNAIYSEEATYREFSETVYPDGLTMEQKFNMLSGNIAEELPPATPELLQTNLSDMIDFAKKHSLHIDDTVSFYLEDGRIIVNDLKITALFVSDNISAITDSQTYESLKNACIENYGFFSEDTTAYVPDTDSVLMSAFVQVDADSKVISSLIADCEKVTDNQTSLSIANSLYSSISSVSDIIKVLSKVFLWGGLVLAAFSMLLLFNFISVSISNKKREIGILRAVGAKSSDVFKIFLCESLIIVCVCALISIILTGLVCSAANNSISNQFGIVISVFVFGIIPVAMIIGIALLSALIATFIPVYNFSRKKPVDTIRSL